MRCSISFDSMSLSANENIYRVYSLAFLTAGIQHSATEMAQAQHALHL